jgi:hypothetical protein
MANLDPIAELKSDHNWVRDILLDIIEASNRKDVVKSLELLLRLDKVGGTHVNDESSRAGFIGDTWL